jgi:dolichyl-phosphate beta-glucosyltransferase
MSFWCECLTQLIVIIVILIIITICLISFLRLISSPIPNIIRYESENYFLNPKTNEKLLFPSLLTDEPSLYLSVIVPAFNEEERLPKMLSEAIDYLENRCLNNKSFSYEIIIVDDGSDDNTTQVALNYVQKYGINKIRVLTLEKNRGKGGAVRLGMISSRGQLLLFCDADGATKFSDFDKLETFMNQNEDSDRYKIAIGSRAHLQKESIASRSLFRTILMYGFHLGVWLLAVRTVKDTQCGFKLFGRQIAKLLFTHIHVEKWAFDVELLLIAERLDCNISEIAVNWTEIEGSKVVPFWSWLQMGKDVAIISFKYAFGLCRLPEIKIKTK